MPRYANSDLSEFRALLFFNQLAKPAPMARQLGTIFHGLLLLNESLPATVSPKMHKQLNAMQKAVWQNKFARQVLEVGQMEQIQLWQDQQTGLPCKAQTDIWVAENELIVDIKTTSARSYTEFLASCEAYGYDRQAAFYLDGKDGAKRFVILGVQKQAPYSVFYFEPSADRPCLEGGRKKYRGLLRGIQRTGFVPSAWGINRLPSSIRRLPTL